MQAKRVKGMPVAMPRKRAGLLLKLSLGLWLAALLYSPFAAALRVGDITVKSAVGERFYAIVPISDTRQIAAGQILVSLAPRSVYQRMGVDWEYFHTGLIFDVIEDEREGIYLRIVSRDVVFEPFIDFVISLRWPSGFISRQFTVLLDMPLSSASASAPVPAAQAARNQPAPPVQQRGTIVREIPELSMPQAAAQVTRVSPPAVTSSSSAQRSGAAVASDAPESSTPASIEQVGDVVSEAAYLRADAASREAAELAKAQQASRERAEAAAAARAAAEARARAEAQARARAEAEARARAEAETRARAEAEARAQAAAAAQAKAAVELRAREVASAEARAIAEVAANAEAEAQARLNA
ncbi:MAG: hypothetical protein WBN40_09665, partial [Pseudomonadales bacterium]